MKNIKHSILALASVAVLASCSVPDNTFYGKTFTYQSDVCYSHSARINNYSDETIGDVLKAQIAADNVNWNLSGAVGLLTVSHFEKHGTYDEMISSMKSMAVSAFDTVYSGVSVTFSSYEEKKVTVKNNSGEKVYTADPYDKEAGQESIYVNLLDENGDIAGAVETPSYVGFSVRNGKFDTIGLTLGLISNYTKFIVTFKNAVNDELAITWNVYAKIAN